MKRISCNSINNHQGLKSLAHSESPLKRTICLFNLLVSRFQPTLAISQEIHFLAGYGANLKSLNFHEPKFN